MFLSKYTKLSSACRMGWPCDSCSANTNTPVLEMDGLLASTTIYTCCGNEIGCSAHDVWPIYISYKMVRFFHNVTPFFISKCKSKSVVLCLVEFPHSLPCEELALSVIPIFGGPVGSMVYKPLTLSQLLLYRMLALSNWFLEVKCT